jgi:teichoic acid transport system permease protein
MSVSEPSTLGAPEQTMSAEQRRALAEEAGLHPVSRRAPLGSYLRSLWGRRHFAFLLAWSRFSARNTHDRLGVLWNVLRPLLQAGVYAAVFGLLLSGSPGRPDNYVEYVTIGVFSFTFMSGALSQGAKAIVGDLGLVRTLRFPRAVLPVASVLGELYAFLPAIGVLAVLLVVLGEPPHLDWLLLPLAVLLMTVFGVGMALLCARITASVRDFTQLLPFVLRILFYLSGVIIDYSRLPGLDAYPVVRLLLEINPFHVYIDLVRQSLLADRGPQWQVWALGAGWAAVTVLVGFLFFWRGEEQYGR